MILYAIEEENEDGEMSVNSAYSENGIGAMAKEIGADGKIFYTIYIWDYLAEQAMEEDRNPKFN